MCAACLRYGRPSQGKCQSSPTLTFTLSQSPGVFTPPPRWGFDLLVAIWTCASSVAAVSRREHLHRRQMMTSCELWPLGAVENPIPNTILLSFPCSAPAAIHWRKIYFSKIQYLLLVVEPRVGKPTTRWPSIAVGLVVSERRRELGKFSERYSWWGKRGATPLNSQILTDRLRGRQPSIQSPTVGFLCVAT